MICSPSRAYNAGISWHSRAARRTITAAIGPTCLANAASTLASAAGSKFASALPVPVGGLAAVGDTPVCGVAMRSVGA